MIKILKIKIFMFQKVMNIYFNLLNNWPKWEKNFSKYKWREIFWKKSFN